MTEMDSLQFREIAGRIRPGCRLLRSWPLAGGVSAQVNALEVIMPDGEIKKLVLRLHGERDRQQNPQVAAHEFRLLQVLQAAGIPSPAPFLLDQSCEVLPHPYLVVEYIDGDTALAEGTQDACLRDLATCLARIHTVGSETLGFLPSLASRVPESLASFPTSQERCHTTQLLRSAWPWSINRQILLHGDYWPGNVLWQDDRLVGIIDWEDAMLGDPLADLANARLELLWAKGAEAVDCFTSYYLEIAGVDSTALSYWDLWVALRKGAQLSGWGLNPATEQGMRGELAQFVNRALEGVDCALTALELGK